jgi:hypothetical protein
MDDENMFSKVSPIEVIMLASGSEIVRPCGASQTAFCFFLSDRMPMSVCTFVRLC